LPEKYPKVVICEEAHQYLIKSPLWDDFVFKKVYMPNFIIHISSHSAKNELAEIMNKLKNGQDVYYACYCQDVKKCHRRIIAGVLKKQGFEVKNFIPEK
jgi:uncharacterized protein YeaO (DUF488 family)